MRLYVARHCRTDWNDQHLVQGHRDIPLNEKGREQSRQLGAALAAEAEPPTIILCSDLCRAVETAEIVSLIIPLHHHGHACEIRTDRRLRECAFGSLDGLTYAEARRLTPPESQKGYPDAAAYDFRPWGGESGQQVLVRQVEAINEARRLFPDHQKMLIGHGRSLTTLLYALGHGPDVPDQGTYRVIDYI